MPRACRRCQGDIWSRVWGEDGTGRAGLGAIAAPSAAAVEDAAAALERAQTELWTAERSRDRVLMAAQSQTPYAFVRLPRPAPPAPDQPPSESQYQSLAADGVETVLELGGPLYWLRLAKDGSGTRINPDLQMTLRLRSRLLRTADNAVLHDYEAEYRSGKLRTLFEWAANDAQAFRTEAEAGLQAVMAKIMDRLFLAEAPADQSAQSH